MTDTELLALVRRTALAEEDKRNHEAAGVLDQAGDALEALQAEVAAMEANQKAYINIHAAWLAAKAERDAALARLAETEKQEPTFEVQREDEKNLEWLATLPAGTNLYAAAGASRVPETDFGNIAP